jgi:threonine/homoserine/homoserine lactone efflux protein
MSFSLRRFKVLYSRFYRWVETAFGTLLIGLGLKIALGSK